MKKPILIAEVKTASPHDNIWTVSWHAMFKIADSVGDILSIHTDAHWWWHFDLITEAKWLTDTPIMAKGIHRTDEEILEAIERWASHVLVVGRIPEVHLDKCFIEVESLKQLKDFYAKLWDDTKFVWNSRDLSDGSLKTETFEEARDIFPGWLCQASNIDSIDDVKPWADAILVWKALENFVKTL